MRLRRSDCSGPGITRRRRGRGFGYYEGGRPVSPETRERIAALAIPPAWEDVWICADERGHIQATGIDARGRKQYRYHDAWRERKDAQKFDSMLRFARALPKLRARVQEDLQTDGADGPTREQALAVAVRLLDRGFFRIGSEDYATTNDSYGLSTLRKSHVRVTGDLMLFDYPAKSNKRRRQTVRDPLAAAIVARMRRRRGGGEELLAYRLRGAWRDVRSDDVNAYLKGVAGVQISAKDFRTWHATVIAAVGLAVTEQPSSAAAVKRAEKRVVDEVARHLGNTPAVARRSYIDPRVFDLFEGGRTIALPDGVGEPDWMHGRVERSVVRLLGER